MIRKALSYLRLHLAEQLGLRDPNKFSALWILDFPLLEWDEESKKYHAMHHPFTSPKVSDIPLLDSDPSSVKANAYDLNLNGNVGINDGENRLSWKIFGVLLLNAAVFIGMMVAAVHLGVYKNFLGLCSRV